MKHTIEQKYNVGDKVFIIEDGEVYKALIKSFDYALWFDSDEKENYEEKTYDVRVLRDASLLATFEKNGEDIDGISEDELFSKKEDAIKKIEEAQENERKHNETKGVLKRSETGTYTVKESSWKWFTFF